MPHSEKQPPPCKSILIIEDDTSIQGIIQTALEIEGYNILTATNGEEGLRILTSHSQLCLVLLDLMMPIMDGWEFIEQMEKNPLLKSTPVVAITAFNEQRRPIKAQEVIKKPIDLKYLFKVVRRYCS